MCLLQKADLDFDRGVAVRTSSSARSFLKPSMTAIGCCVVDAHAPAAGVARTPRAAVGLSLRWRHGSERAGTLQSAAARSSAYERQGCSGTHGSGRCAVHAGCRSTYLCMDSAWDPAHQRLAAAAAAHATGSAARATVASRCMSSAGAAAGRAAATSNTVASALVAATPGWRSGGLTVAGPSARPVSLSAASAVEVSSEEREESTGGDEPAAPVQFRILFQDEHLVAIEKPSGYHVHPPGEVGSVEVGGGERSIGSDEARKNEDEQCRGKGSWSAGGGEMKRP